jgi:hypothetical protein
MGRVQQEEANELTTDSKNNGEIGCVFQRKDAAVFFWARNKDQGIRRIKRKWQALFWTNVE